MNIIDKYFYNWWEILVTWVVRKLLSWSEDHIVKPKRFKFTQHLKKHNFTKRVNTLRSLSGGATRMPHLINWDGMLSSGGLREQQMLQQMLQRMEIEREEYRLRQMERSNQLYLTMLEQRRLRDSYRNEPSKSF